MAIYETLSGRITDTNVAWQDKSGLHVEDFICQSISDLGDKDISSLAYDATSHELSLFNKKGQVVAHGPVSPAEPAYSHNFNISKILINDEEMSGDNIQCLLGKSNIKLKVLYSLIAENPLTGNKNHITGKQKLSIKIGNKGFIDIPTGIASSDQELIIDITDYFTDTTVGPVTLKVTTFLSGILEDDRILTASTSTISVLNPKISYGGTSYIVNGITYFQVLNGGGASYNLRYRLNEGDLNRSNSFNIDLTTPGLNKLEVYAVLANNENIATESLNVQVINIKSQENFDSLLVAVNEISEVISNWEYSKMYRLSLYTKGVSDEFINIDTKLTNTAVEDDCYFNKTKQLETYLINSKETNPYCYEEDVCYFFGMSDLIYNTVSNLVVKVNNEDVISFDDCIQLNINSDSAFAYTEGANYYYDLFNPDDSNIITKEVLSKIESPDGIVQEDNLTVFKVSAKDYDVPVINQPLSEVLTNSGFTFELDFKSYNISDLNKSVLKLGKFILYPTELNWQFSESENLNEKIDKTSRSSLFLEGVRTHLVIQIAPDFKAPLREIPKRAESLSEKRINIVRIFINGIIDREFKFDSLSDFNLNGFNLEIAPEASDIDIYDLRIYNRALTLEEISNNYVSTMSNINEKKSFQKNNDIVAIDTNNNTYISYTLAKLLYNTLVFIVPKGNLYIHQLSATKLTEVKDCTVFVNYVNHEKLPTKLTDEQIAKSSGRFTDVTLKGQGTSAMKYYWYNTSIKGKFTSHGCYDQNDQIYKQPDEGKDLLYNNSLYYMPTDPNTPITKLVGKTNYASSMLSHKIGATRAYHDLWSTCVNMSSFNNDELKGRRAVLEEPFLAFYIESDIEPESMNKITPLYLETIDDSLIKFAGFQTWGSGKKDKATSGYDKNTTPGYLLLEGAENNGKLPNFLMPWSPDCIKLSKDTLVTLEKKGDNNIGEFDSFDVNFGVTEIEEDKLYEFNEVLTETLNRFIEAYNFIYMHTINLEAYSGKSSLNSAENKTLLDVTKKYYITNAQYQDSTGFEGRQWDVFRYDQYSSMWVPAGLPILDENGKQVIHNTITSPNKTEVFDYEVFNLRTFYKENGGTGAENINNFKQMLINKFKERFGDYFHIEDLCFHQAFIKLFAGTDNRAKNTYFKLLNKDCKISMLLDDLDTILATDNRGLLKKPYFLLEPSQESDPEYKGMWGGSNAFFELFDIAYKEDIDLMLESILTKFDINLEPDIHNWMQKYFYYVQEYFPATAYNHMTRLCYECAQVIYDNQGIIGISWENNGQDPVSQAHGSCLQSEKEFMKKRLIMFLSLAQISNIFGKDAMGITIKAKEDAGSSSISNYTINITPYQYLYLGYNIGSNPVLYSLERQSEGVPFEAKITIDSDTPLYSVLGSRYIKKFDDFSKIYWKGSPYHLSANRLIEMSARTETGEQNRFLPSSISLETPVLTKLDLTGVSSLTTINLDSDHTPKLKEVYLTGTNITNVNLPTGSRLKTIYFPKTLKELRILNNPGLETVKFEGYSNIETVYIDCAKCGNFDVADFCEKLSEVALKKVTLKNINNIYLTEDTLDKLITVDCILEGEITIIDEVGSTTPKDISFATKLKLVNKFGNINNGSNGLKINYTSSSINREDIQYPDEVSAFYNTNGSSPLTFDGLFALTITSGNNVNIVDEANPHNPKVIGHLDIRYELKSPVTGVEVNDISGAIKLSSELDTNSTANVIISVFAGTNTFKNNGEGANPKPTRVNFAWKVPQLGDFAYADGTFSNYYNSNKTIVGLVYAKEEETTEKGIVYVVGAEYSNIMSHYTGYNSRNGSPQAGIKTVEGLIYKLGQYLSTGLSVSNYYPSVNSFANMNNLNEITESTGSTIMSLTMSGKEDTLAYVLLVNSLLPKLTKKGIKLDIVNDDNGEYIKDISALNNCCTTLDNSSLNESTYYNSALLYPYFYSAYLYEPTVKNSETLHEAYKKGNWYAPSLGELARIIYYRGYSASDTFDMPAYVRAAINEKVKNGGTVLTTPIFSLAKERGYLADVWNNIVGSENSGTANNIITTRNLSEGDRGDNYSYQTWSDWFGTNQYTKWIEGGYSSSGGGEEYSAKERTWSYTKHFGLPFTQIGYEKP